MVGSQRLNGYGRKLKIQSTPRRKAVNTCSECFGAAVYPRRKCRGSAVGRKELACGGQEFKSTSLFDPSMSALPIIVSQKVLSVGLFTH